MRTSIKKNNDGSYIVKLPLWEPQWEEIHITKNELKNAKVIGSDWYKLIEVAFAHFCEEREIKSEEDLKNICYWMETNSMDVLLWREGYKTESYHIPPSKNDVIQKLKDFNPNKWDIISFSRSDRLKKNGLLPTNHVMIITQVYKNENWDVTWVQIENPWNNPHSETWGDASQKDITIDEFLDFAFSVTCGSITDDFLNTKSSNYLAAQQSKDRWDYEFQRLGNDWKRIKEVRKKWNFDPSIEWVKNIPGVVSDYLVPIWDWCKHIGNGVWHLGKAAWQWLAWLGKNAREGTKDVVEWGINKIKSWRNK
jgi:hypothetical protein